MDMEKFLRDATTSGKSLDELAKELDAMIQKMKDADKAKSEREAFIQSIYKELDKRLDDWTKPLSLQDCAKLVLIQVAAPQHPEWTVENMKEFLFLFQESTNFTMDSVTKSPADMLKSLLKDMSTDLNEHVAKAVSKAAEKKSNSDSDAIHDFITREIEKSVWKPGSYYDF